MRPEIPPAMLLRLLFCLTAFAACCAAAEHPHVLWITSEDNGPQLGCYGDQYATTPNLDLPRSA